MRIVLQRVTKASVVADGVTVGEIGTGLLALVAANDADTPEIAHKMANKIFKLRIFSDENGKTNLSAEDVGAEILMVSQFTLFADTKKGNRPSFTKAGTPAHAEFIMGRFAEDCEGLFAKTQTGVFGADMKVSLINDGPFTVILDSEQP